MQRIALARRLTGISAWDQDCESKITAGRVVMLANPVPPRKVPEYVFRYFPMLHSMLERKGGVLSGGQQQPQKQARFTERIAKNQAHGGSQFQPGKPGGEQNDYERG
jgi:hypothetical protein